MTRNTLSANWRGEYATPIDPAAVSFKIAPAVDGCEFCCFLGQRTSVCRAASDIAKAAGGFDCDERLPDGRALIYVLARVDPRQVDLVGQGGEAVAVTTESPITNN